jgi:hypothetical protein
LLIAQLPEGVSPSEFWNSLRHHGFHQYVERLLPSCPHWLAEEFGRLVREYAASEEEYAAEIRVLSRFLPSSTEPNPV